LLASVCAIAQPPEGIAVSNALVEAKCGTCHPKDKSGMIEHVSTLRSTPEGWQSVLNRMEKAKRVALDPTEKKALIGYLSVRHGLAPEEARAVRYDPEKRIVEETIALSDSLSTACTRCHSLARALQSRRTFDEWLSFSTAHVAMSGTPLNEEALAFLTKAAPIHTPEWDVWSAQGKPKSLAGQWFVTANLPGRGQYVGEMKVAAGAQAGDLSSMTTLRSVRDGSVVERAGTSVVWGGSSWRGRSKGGSTATPDDPTAEAKEVMVVDSTGSRAEGRWYWGEYQEFGFDVVMQRATADPVVLAIDRLSLAAGSKATVRVIGRNFATGSGVSFGAGVKVVNTIVKSGQEIVAEVDVAADAPSGKRDVVLGKAVLPAALAVYDRVDYLMVLPDSSLAGFGGPRRPRGYQQFEAIGFQRGPDGRAHTEDDLRLGPIDAAWSMEVFYVPEGVNLEPIGKVTDNGLFVPNSESPNNNFDVWVIATAKSEKDKNGKALVGKGFLVVTVPEYVFGGRRYIRELDRWVEQPQEQGK
jgi:quinohemoprotein amine dehydrogenase